jgi:glutathione synthase
MARGHWVTFKDQTKDFYVLGKEALLNLKEARFVLMRQDPPFDMAYIATTHLLELLPPTTRVINDPKGVRDAPEKLLVTYFKDLMPPTLMSWDPALIEDFIKAQGSVILKPLFEFGGNGILLLHHGDPNLIGILETYRKLYREPPIFQKFLPEVALGDKRIILIDGKPVGIFKRIPLKGQARSNMRLGGRPEACDFSPRDREICDRIGPTLKKRGLYLVGIDVIGDYLTEINVTSPTGMRVMNRLYNLDLGKDFWAGLI